MILTYYTVNLINGGQAGFDNLIAQIEKIPGAEHITESMTEEGIMVGYTVPEGIVHIVHSFESGDIAIQALRQ